MKPVFPEIITNLPEAGLPLEGLKIYISHSETHEVWFLQSEVAIDYPPHAHAAQWAVVLAGQIEVTICCETKCYTKGDTYFLPEGVEHSVKIHPGYAEVIFLNDPNFLGR